MTAKDFSQGLRDLINDAHHSQVPSATIVGNLAVAYAEQGFLHSQATQRVMFEKMASDMAQVPPTKN